MNIECLTVTKNFFSIVTTHKIYPSTPFMSVFSYQSILEPSYLTNLVISLQVTKIRNVSAPKSNEESHAAPRMLKLTLTDGHATCHAVEVAKLEKISLTTPPGTKVRLRPGQKIPVKGGFLQLGPGQG